MIELAKMIRKEFTRGVKHPRHKDIVLQFVLEDYFKIYPKRKIKWVGRYSFDADKFFHWLFTYKNEFVRQNHYDFSIALLIVQQFYKSPHISVEMGKGLNKIHFYHVNKERVD
jgi:hypothetical protein